jgi:hypothetical protein
MIIEEMAISISEYDIDKLCNNKQKNNCGGKPRKLSSVIRAVVSVDANAPYLE